MNDNYNFSYFHFISNMRLNVKTFKNHFEYKIYLNNQENFYVYVTVDSVDKDQLKNELFKKIIEFSKTNKLEIDRWDPYWKSHIENGIQTLTFPKC